MCLMYVNRVTVRKSGRRKKEKEKEKEKKRSKDRVIWEGLIIE
jgi:hypothetical protein